MRGGRWLLPLALLLLTACGPGSSTPPSAPPPVPAVPEAGAAKGGVSQGHLDAALRHLQAMNTAAAAADWAAARQSVAAYQQEWESLRPAALQANPSLANILQQAMQEMEGELAKPQPQGWEFDEETTKAARLLAQLAPKLGLTIDPALVPPQDKISLPPFHGELTIEVMARDYTFTPDSVTVQKGNKVTLRLVNRSAQPHELVVDGYGEVENVPPGDSRELIFVAERPGTFEFACHLPGHFEAGMRGTLRVR